MKRTGIIGLILGSAIVVFGGMAAMNRYRAIQETARNRNAIVNVITESNRDVYEMRAIVNSHAEGTDKVHAMTEAIPAMTDKMKDIDVTNCPPDFQQAYLRYRQAWEGVGEKTAQLPQSSVDALAQAFTGVTGALVGDDTPNNNDPMSAQSDELRTATNALESLALRYDARIAVTR
jgi:hypothetical protein